MDNIEFLNVKVYFPLNKICRDYNTKSQVISTFGILPYIEEMYLMIGNLKLYKTVQNNTFRKAYGMRNLTFKTF